MRILVISNLYPPHYLGGYELLCAQVSEHLERRGHQVIVLTSSHGVDREPAEDHPSRVHRALSLYQPFDQPPRVKRFRRWWVGRRNFAITRRVVEEEQPDLIFVWSQLRLTIGGARAAEASGLPVAYAFNDEHIAGFVPARFGPGARTLARWLADNLVFRGITTAGLRFSRVVCVSQTVKRALLERGLDVHAAEVVYQGIPLERYPAKADIGGLGSPVRLLYVGQLVPSKGVDTLIRGVDLLVSGDHAPAVTLSIAGEGPDYYTQRLKTLGSESRVLINWIGKVPYDALSGLYREHDVFIFPSRGPEAFGLTHLEAMASGTPVISTVEGGHGELVKDGENALAFRREDPEDLARQLARLIRDDGLRRDLALRARNLVEREFGFDRYAARIEKFLSLTMAESGRPRQGS